MNNIIRRVCFSLAVAVFSLGLSTSTATAATRLTPAHLYNWARTGNTPRLQQFKRYINLQDRNQNTALCLAQHAQDRNAYALLLKFGASTDVPCHDDDDPICAVIAGEKTKLTPAGWLLLGAGAAAGAYLLLDDDDDDDDNPVCPTSHPLTEQCQTGNGYNTNQDMKDVAGLKCYSCAYSCDTAAGWYTTCPAGKACDKSITLPDGSDICYQVTGCPAGSYTNKATCETENPGYTCVENATGSDCWIPNGNAQCPSGYDTRYQSPADCGVGGAQGWKVEFNGQSGDEKCGKCVPLACDTNTALKCNDGTYTEVTRQTITDYNGNTPCYTCKFSCKAPYYSDPGQCASGHACTALPEENGLTCYKEGGLLQCPIDFRDPECLNEGKGFTVSEETQELDDGTLCYKCDYACADGWTAGPCPDGKTCDTINTPVQCYTNPQCPADYPFTDKTTCETDGYICKESATGSGCWKRDGSEDCPDDSETTICST